MDYSISKPDSTENYFPISLYIANPTALSPDGYDENRIDLPITADAFTHALKSIYQNQSLNNEYFFHSPSSNIDGLALKLKAIIADEKIREPETFNELNYLAGKLQKQSEKGLAMFSAVIETTEDIHSVADLINVVENLKMCDLRPFKSPKDYGEFLIRRGYTEFETAVSDLRESEFQEEQELAEHIDLLYQHLNPESFGKANAEKENGIFTDKGYLTKRDEFWQVYNGSDGIPPEYKVISDTFPPMKLENRDLINVLIQLHALYGDYTSDVVYNTNILANSQSDNFLLLVSGCNIHITDATKAFHKGDPEFDIWLNAPDTPETKVFFLHKTAQTHKTIGDMIELNLTDLQRDMIKNSINFNSVHAILKDGSQEIYSDDEWNVLELIERNRVQSYVLKYNYPDMVSVQYHIIESFQDYYAKAVGIDLNTFLALMNKGYMDKAPNPQPDMLRISRPAAAEILAHGAPVYRLLPKGAEKISPMDAVHYKGLWYENYREFAVKKEDIGAVAKWAERQKDIIFRQVPEKAPKNDHDRS